MKYVMALVLLLNTVSETIAQNTGLNKPPVSFKKHIINPAFVSEGAATGDVNRDGRIDILAGNYWYEAPNWKSHMLHADTADPVPEYSTTFLNYCMDINNDGWADLIRFDLPGGVCIWYENPKGSGALWRRHLILASAGIESPAFVDVDGDGRNDIICNDTLAKEVIWLKSPVAENDTVWSRYAISQDRSRATNRYTHGLGWGDVNKDGRNDVIIKSGWWESPEDPKQTGWKFHGANFGDDCGNMFALDADRDGDIDILSSSAHNYGVWWHEQKQDQQGSPVWQTNELSKLFSQSHALAMKDIDGDGNPDLVTGKRYRAHNDGDPGAFEPSVLYWFKYVPGNKPQWIPHLIDDNSGIGNSFVVDDINSDKLPDIVVSNKKGVFFFEQLK